ncbi:MAG: hypothetical protein ABEH35_03680 [Haloarculaceae archaeon]
MSDSPEESVDERGERVAPEQDSDDATDDIEALREQVEAEYDFENFGPADMAEMTVEEWQAAFDPDTWITGDDLLDRVVEDLRSRVANRDVFARIERHTDPPRVLAYSDEGYALVYPDGSIEGEGTVLRDVKPTVALCSMESYDVPDAPEGDLLPDPSEVPEGGGELGHRMLQIVGAIQLLAGLVLVGAGAVVGVTDLGSGNANVVTMVVAGLGFLVIGGLMFLVVVNARLSDRFRAEEYRDRLRAVGLEDGERPDFLPPLEGDRDEPAAAAEGDE